MDFFINCNTVLSLILFRLSDSKILSRMRKCFCFTIFQRIHHFSYLLYCWASVYSFSYLLLFIFPSFCLSINVYMYMFLSIFLIVLFIFFLFVSLFLLLLLLHLLIVIFIYNRKFPFYRKIQNNKLRDRHFWI